MSWQSEKCTGRKGQTGLAADYRTSKTFVHIRFVTWLHGSTFNSTSECRPRDLSPLYVPSTVVNDFSRHFKIVTTATPSWEQLCFFTEQQWNIVYCNGDDASFVLVIYPIGRDGRFWEMKWLNAGLYYFMSMISAQLRDNPGRRLGWKDLGGFTVLNDACGCILIPAPLEKLWDILWLVFQ